MPIETWGVYAPGRPFNPSSPRGKNGGEQLNAIGALRSDNRQSSPRAGGCLGGTFSEGEGRLSSALSVGFMRSLNPFGKWPIPHRQLKSKSHTSSLQRMAGYVVTARDPVPPISLSLLSPKSCLINLITWIYNFNQEIKSDQHWAS